MVAEHELSKRHGHRELAKPLCVLRLVDNGRETRACVTFGDRATQHGHQTVRPRTSGHRKRSELTLTDVFRISHVDYKNVKKARSPNLTHAHVWRPARLKRASSATQTLIFHWFPLCFKNTTRKRKKHYVGNVWWPSIGPDFHEWRCTPSCRAKVLIFDWFYMCFASVGKLAICATRMLKGRRNDLAAHT